MAISLAHCPLADDDDISSVNINMENSIPFGYQMHRQCEPESTPSTSGDDEPAPDFPGIAIVEAGRHAKRNAVSKLLSLKESCKFIFVVNNMTGFNLIRTDSVGGDSWPFSSVKKGECVAALYNQSTISSLAVEFTATGPEPGVRTVVLYASWPTIGSRNIGVFAGKQAKIYPWYNFHFKKVHDHKWRGNRATICNHENCYVYEYDLKELDYVQFAVPANRGISDMAIESFRVYKGSLPDFVFVVNNLTGFDLTLEDDQVSKQGIWPLGDIKKGECAVAGCDGMNMSLAAHYAARKAVPRQKSISLAGSWPAMGCRKIFFSPGRCAKYAWKHMKTSPYEHNDNSAKIIENKEEKSCIYYYELTNL